MSPKQYVEGVVKASLARMIERKLLKRTGIPKKGEDKVRS